RRSPSYRYRTDQTGRSACGCSALGRASVASSCEATRCAEAISYAAGALNFAQAWREGSSDGFQDQDPVGIAGRIAELRVESLWPGRRKRRTVDDGEAAVRRIVPARRYLWPGKFFEVNRYLTIVRQVHDRQRAIHGDRRHRLIVLGTKAARQ